MVKNEQYFDPVPSGFTAYVADIGDDDAFSCVKHWYIGKRVDIGMLEYNPDMNIYAASVHIDGACLFFYDVIFAFEENEVSQ